MTSVLVTGAGGYIGQRLTRQLATAGHEVRALVRTSVAWPPGVTEVVGDLVRDQDVAARAAEGMDVVVHLAGANEAAMAGDPDRAMAETVTAARNVATSGVGRVIYLSTVHVYGDSLLPGSVVSESTEVRPVHPYAMARLACEEVFAAALPDCVSFRLTNGVGAPAAPSVQRWTLVANELCREGALSGLLTLRTSGAQWRDFVALSDVEQVVASVVREPVPAGVYNLASGEPMTVRDLALLIADRFDALTGSRPTLVAPDLPDISPGPYRIDIDRLSDLGLSATTPLADAVDETILFCLEHRDALAG
jgi:UDP-glucose 4-epimerase